MKVPLVSPFPPSLFSSEAELHCFVGLALHFIERGKQTQGERVRHGPDRSADL